MAHAGERVPWSDMNAWRISRQFHRLNEPLALFFATPQNLHEPRGPKVAREFPIGVWATPGAIVRRNKD
jgi:hypothetical protein